MPEETEAQEVPSAADLAGEIITHSNRLKELKKKIAFAPDDASCLALAMKFCEEMADTVMSLMADLATVVADSAESVEELEAEVFGIKIGPEEQNAVAEALMEAIESSVANPALKEKLEIALDIVAGEDDDDDDAEEEAPN